ncbi:MAG: HAMP domain-containing sensor histidine kinase [Chloroflexota bacterium]
MKSLFSTKQFFSHVTFADAEKQRLAHLVFQLLRLFLIAIVLTTIALWILTPAIHSQVVLLATYFPILLFLVYWLRQGKVTLVSWGYIISLWILLTIFILLFEGIRSPAFYSYVMVIVLAGLLLDKRAEILFLALSVLIGFVSFLMETNGILPNPMYETTLLSDWIGVTASVVILTFLIQRATDGWRMTVKRQQEAAIQNERLRQQAEQQAVALQEANLQLQELDHLKTKFIRDMTHELRTPLTNLKLYLDLWEMAPAEKKPLYRQTLQQQNERLTHLMEAVSRVARLDARIGIDQKQEVNLNEFVLRVADAYQSQIGQKGLWLTLDLQQGLPHVWGVSSLLLEVVEHLIGNAVLYSPQGNIVVQSYQAENQICLRVADEGIGIAAHEQKRIFDRFYRADNVGELAIAGAGLGLTIVERVIDLHDGTIMVESELGKGAVFTACLPPYFKDS